MVAISVTALGVSDPPPYEADPTIKAHSQGDLELLVINGGMASLEPSIALVAHDPEGLIIIETSLLALLAAARSAQAMAETQFGWRMPP